MQMYMYPEPQGQPFINACFNWMIPNLDIENGWKSPCPSIYKCFFGGFLPVGLWIPPRHSQGILKLKNFRPIGYAQHNDDRLQVHGTPRKINILHIIPWRFGSDHFPFFLWVMAVGSSR